MPFRDRRDHVLNLSDLRCRQKERRIEQEKLRKVKTLGEAGEDVDDLGAWVARNKKAEERAKADARAKAAKLARQLEEQVCTSCQSPKLRQHKHHRI